MPGEPRFFIILCSFHSWRLMPDIIETALLHRARLFSPIPGKDPELPNTRPLHTAQHCHYCYTLFDSTLSQKPICHLPVVYSRWDPGIAAPTRNLRAFLSHDNLSYSPQCLPGPREAIRTTSRRVTREGKLLEQAQTDDGTQTSIDLSHRRPRLYRVSLMRYQHCAGNLYLIRRAPRLLSSTVARSVTLSPPYSARRDR